MVFNEVISGADRRATCVTVLKMVALCVKVVNH
jgi:hypothetical protein